MRPPVSLSFGFRDMAVHLKWNGGVMSLCMAVLAAAALLSAGGPSPARAQSVPERWSTSQLISEGAAISREPALAVDPSGGVHAVWQSISSDGTRRERVAIYYARSMGSAWSKPVDIVAASTIAPSPRFAIVPDGTAHLLWYGEMGRLYYARTSSGSSASAGWSRQATVEPAHPHADLVAGQEGYLHRAYGRLGSAGTYYQRSVDGGTTWTFPMNVALPQRSGSGADWVRLAVTEKGIVHVVWTEFRLPTGWPPTGIYHSRSADGGRSWSPPVELAGEGHDQVNVALHGEDVVHAAWNGMAGVGGRYHRWSSDGGFTWSPALSVVPAGRGGTEGPPQLALDSAGTVHLLTTYGSRVWYSFWKDGSWSEPVYVPSGDEAGIPPPGTGFSSSLRHIEEPAMAISGGNQLHALFWDRRQEQYTKLWYSSLWTRSPSLPAAPAATKPVQLPPTPVQVSSAIDTPAGQPEAEIRESGSAASDLVPRGTAYSGLWAVALLLGAFVSVRLVRSRSE